MSVRRILNFCLGVIFIILFIRDSIVIDSVSNAIVWLALSLTNIYLGFFIKEDEK